MKITYVKGKIFSNIAILIGTPKRNYKYFILSVLALVEETQETIKIKIALSLNKLAEFSKKKMQNDSYMERLNTSYSEIADSSNIRKATVSDIFNANKSANSFTLIRIIRSMGYQVTDFGSQYDKITDEEIINFKSTTTEDA